MSASHSSAASSARHDIYIIQVHALSLTCFIRHGTSYHEQDLVFLHFSLLTWNYLHISIARERTNESVCLHFIVYNTYELFELQKYPLRSYINVSIVF